MKEKNNQQSIIHYNQTNICRKAFTKKNFYALAEALKKGISEILHSDRILAKQSSLSVEIGEVVYQRFGELLYITFDIYNGGEDRIEIISYYLDARTHLRHSFGSDEYEAFYETKIEKDKSWEFYLPHPDSLQSALNELLPSVSLYWFKLALQK